jgi:hypothetical protein
VERFAPFGPEYAFQSAVLTRKDENINKFNFTGYTPWM